MAAASDVLVERSGAVTRITFNRPGSLNAFTLAMLEHCAAVVEATIDDPDVRAVVLTGTGRAFSAGADLAGGGDPGKEDPRSGSIDAANRLTRAIRATPKPVIAAVNGPAVGVGCTFALAADLAVARESAYFLLAFANVGLMPDRGATAIIPAAVGRARATRIAMLAERIPAALALEWGLISHTAPDGDFDAEVRRLTEQLANGPTASYAQTKRAFNATALAGLDHAQAVERDGQCRLFGTADHAEGVAAFREKRTPRFIGA